MSVTFKSTQGGFTLVEAMVAFLVLAIGLIGMSGLLTVGVQTNQHAYLRTQAIVLAEDMADRIRSNPAEDYVTTDADGTSPCVGTTTTACGGSMAAYDKFEWNQQLALMLPNAQYVICLDSSPNDGTVGASACSGDGAVTVKIWWADSENVGTGSDEWFRHVIVAM